MSNSHSGVPGLLRHFVDFACRFRASYSGVVDHPAPPVLVSSNQNVLQSFLFEMVFRRHCTHTSSLPPALTASATKASISLPTVASVFLKMALPSPNFSQIIS